MWHLGIFPLFLLLQAISSSPLSLIINESHNQTNLASELTRVAKSMFLLQDKQLNEIKTALTDTSEKKRFKRELDVPEQRDSEESITLRDVVLLSTLIAPSVISDVVYARTKFNIYLVGAGKMNLGRSRGPVPNPIWRWSDYNNNFELLTTVETAGSVAVEGFVIEDNFYFIFAINTRRNLLDFVKHPAKLFRINSDGEVIQLQTFPTVGATGWKYFSHKGDHYLVQTSLVQWKRNAKLMEKYAHVAIAKGSSKINIFKWNGIAFTHSHSLEAMHSTKVDVMTITGRTLIVAVNQSFDETEVKSTVLIYELYASSDGREHFKLIQGIRGWAVSDVHFARFREKNFLFIANEFRVQNGQKVETLDSVVYLFNGFFFIKYQNITTTCALKWSTLNGIENQASLHLLSAKKESVFQFIDGTWTLDTSISLLKPAGVIPAVTVGIKSFLHQQKNIVALASREKVYLMELIFVRRPPVVDKLELNTKCKGIFKNLGGLTRDRQQYGLSRDRAASSKSQQRLVGIKHFQDVKIRNLRLENMKVVRTNLYRQQLMKHLNSRQAIFTSIPRNLDGYLKKSTVQDISRNVTVDNFFVDKIETVNTEFNSLHDVSFCKFLSQIQTFDQTSSQSSITMRAKFNRLKFENDITIRGTLNSVTISNGLVFLDRPNKFVAPKTFANEIFVNGSLKVKSTVNNVRPEHILLTHGHQIINTETIIHGDVRVVSVDVIRNRKVAGIDWNWLVNETVRIDKPIIMRGRKKFQSDVKIFGDFAPKGRVSGVDMKNLLTKAIPLVRPNRFLRPVTFTRVDFQKDVIIGGKINGISVPSDLIQTSKKLWEVSLVMSHSFDLRQLVVRGFINGQKIDKDHVITRHGEQTITGLKKFNTIRVHPSLSISGLVNGVNITHLLRKIQSGVIVADTHYPKLTVHNLNVRGRLPHDLNRLFYESVKLNEDIIFKGHVTFDEQTIFERNLELPPVLFEQLVPVKSPKPVHLPTEYLDDIVFENNIVVEGLVNNVDLVRFSNNILKISGHQIIRSPKTFVGTVHVGRDSVIKGKVNEISLKDTVKINEDSFIKGKVIFQVPPVVYGFSEFETTIVMSSLNNRHVTHWFEDTLLISSAQNITAPKKFIGNVNIGEGKIYKNLDVDGAVFLNGAALKEFVEDVVLVDETNILLQETTFLSHLKIRELETVTIDDINIVNLYENALRLKEDRCVTITKSVDVKHLQTTFINDDDIKAFFNKVVFVDDLKLPSLLTFHHVIAPEVVAEGFVNGLEFATDVVRISSKDAIEISGGKKFHGGLKFDRVDLNGKINGIDLEYLNKHAVKQGIPQTITAVWTVEELIVNSNVHVKDQVGGLNFTAFLENSWFVDEIAIIYEQNEFFALHHTPAPSMSMQITGFLDNVDISHAFDDVVTVDERKEITGVFTFENSVTFNNVSVPNIVCSSAECLVNDKVLPQWQKQIMKKNTYQIVTAPKTFRDLVSVENVVTVAGRVNHISTDDIMRVGGQQRIYDDKIFTHVIVVNLEVRGSLMDMDVDVVTWERESTFLDEPSSLVFRVHNEFSSLVLDHDAFFKRGIADVITSDIVTVDGEQKITGRKIFGNEIVTLPWKKSMDLLGEVNGVRETFTTVISRLLSFPLPYPCSSASVYFREGCYEVIPQPNARCRSGMRLRTINDFERDLLRTMKLIEKNDSWFIRNSVDEVTVCRLDASVHVNKTITLRGSFRFNLDATVIINESKEAMSPRHLMSPLLIQYAEDSKNYSIVVRKIESATINLDNHQHCVCSAMNNFESALENAYRPVGTIDNVQTIDVEVLDVYLLDPKLSGEDLGLLVVEKDAISLYLWRGERFDLVASLRILQLPFNSKVDISQDAKSGVVIVTVLTSIHCKNSDMMDEFKIFYLNVITASNFGPRIELSQESSKVRLNCIPESNVRPILINEDVYFTYGIKNEISISKWNDPDRAINLRLYQENIDIYHVYPVDFNGRIAVASQFNGVNFFTIYQTNLINQKLEAVFNLYNLPKFLKMTVASQHDLIFLTKTQLHLMHYESAIREFSIRQVIDIYCPLDLFWLNTRDFHWLVVASCRISYFYSFNGYLQQLYEVGEVVIGEPEVYNSDAEFIAVLPVANDNGREIKILKGNMKGPARTIDCPGKC